MDNIKDINIYDNKQKIWRYIKVDRLIDIIEKEEIYFSSAVQFADDPYEGAISIVPEGTEITTEKIFEDAFSQLRRLTKIICWHISDCENDAMWKLYANFKKGLAITTTIESLINSLEPYKIKPEYASETLNVGKIEYIDLMNETINQNMMNRFFYKHNAFSWEKEFRLTISLRMAEEFGVLIPEDGIFVKINPKILIKNIYLGPSISDEDRKKILDVCEKNGIENRIKISSLLGKPIYSTKIP